MLTKPLLAILWCPACRAGALALHPEPSGEPVPQEGELHCASCAARFPVHGGVPDLIPHDRLDSGAWETWSGHLDGFSQRREERARKPSAAQRERWRAKRRAFLDFLEVPDGMLLDVGCGPGGVREGIDPERTDYVGIDPIPTEEAARDFPYARAVAEHMPFRDEAFTGMVIRSALDHFCDLDAFFREAARVLRQEGVLFIEQAVHEGRSAVGLLKHAAHWGKDWLDDLKTGGEADAPKHMSEFTRDDLLEAPADFFTVVETRSYSPSLLSATQMFLALRRR